jgi:putative phosphoribosyl transferase
MKETLKIDLGKVTLEGKCTMASNPSGVIVFVQGSDSGRYNPRYNFVAQYLNKQGYITLLLDLYTRQDPEFNYQEFNLELLANRLRDVTIKLKSHSNFTKLPFGFYGSNTGAAVAIKAASYLKKNVHAVICKGSRIDLIIDALNLIQTPTLFLVGENDPHIKNLNRESLNRIKAPNELKFIPNASHLFEEAGALESVALEAEGWFGIHLNKSARVRKHKLKNQHLI